MLEIGSKRLICIFNDYPSFGKQDYPPILLQLCSDCWDFVSFRCIVAAKGEFCVP
jgi:hypothetical protein